MKLTNYIRDAFVRSVMADVPKVDHSEAIRKMLTTISLEVAPKSIQKIWNDLEMRPYLTSTAFNAGGVSATAPWFDGTYEERKAYRKKIEDDPRLVPLVDAKAAQDKALAELERKIEGTAYAFTTRKALAEAIPEFAKYLPADEPTALRALPVVANVVSEFIKAGWPKDKKDAA